MKGILLLALLAYGSGTIFGQTKDSINLKEICIEKYCFGCKMSEILKHFGNADTVTYNPMGDGEFEEPAHRTYYYNQLRFYEILWPEQSRLLFYGCTIERKNTHIFLKGNEIIIGTTHIQDVENYFPISSNCKKKLNESQIIISLSTVLPPELIDFRGTFISELNLIFTNGILSTVWTPLDKN